MPKPRPAALTLAIAAAVLCAAPAHTATTDRALLLTFCDAANIKGSTCKRAKGYPNAPRRGCDVTLRAERYGGKFLSAGNPLFVVFYDSGCEAHATDNGGAVVFEQVGGAYNFKSFQPGMLGSECLTLPKSEQQDVLVCLTGHMGQGILESGVAQMTFNGAAGKRPTIAMDLDMLLRAEDTDGAYGANTVTCKDDRFKVFDVEKLAAGPRPQTVTVEATYADAAIIETACGKGFPKPDDAIGELPPGDAYVPEGHAKSGTLVIDLETRKIAPR
jgi:hypothetical protein